MHEGLPEGTLTLLFTDVEGSTDLTTRLGDEAAQRILRSHRQLVQRQVDQFADRGRFRLKGFADRWHLYQVLWEREGDVSGPVLLRRTPFVGRQSEREQLRRCLEQAVRGQGSLVLLSGEPGVGKSRLAEQVAVEARDQEVLVLSGHCYEMEMLPYAPFVEILDTATRSMDRAALQVALGEGAG